jgi:hypothetical protein
MRYIHSEEALTIPDNGKLDNDLILAIALGMHRQNWDNTPRLMLPDIDIEMSNLQLYSQGHHKIETDHCGGSARYAPSRAAE